MNPFPFLAAVLSTCLAAASCLQAQNVELKFFVAEAGNDAAWKILEKDGLKAKKHHQEQVCFFETSSLSLGADHKLILRTRKQAGKPADSTVKVRLEPGEPTPGPVETLVVPEEDWSTPDKPEISRSIDWDILPDGMFEQVMTGKTKIQAMFEGAAQPAQNEVPASQGNPEKPAKPAVPPQADLIKERAPSLDWSQVHRYGPFTAQVWKKQFHLSAAFPEVTVEDWMLEKTGAKPQREVLELSVKLKLKDGTDVKQSAAAFFSAIKAAGFGEPESTSKTKLVLEQYQPGATP